MPQPIGFGPRRVLAKTPPKPQSHLQWGYVTGCRYQPTSAPAIAELSHAESCYM